MIVLGEKEANSEKCACQQAYMSTRDFKPQIHESFCVFQPQISEIYAIKGDVLI